MRVIKSFNQALLTRVFEAQKKRYFCATVGYLFSFGSTQVKTEVDLWQFAAQQLGKETPLDAAMPKARGEVLVMGKACAPGGKPVQGMQVGFHLGPLSKSLDVFGDRSWRKKLLHHVISDPAFFTEMELGYSHSFGGPGYELNPLGKGIVPVAGPAGEPEVPLPNLEDPRRLVLQPQDRPEPANFGPIDLTWPQRMKKVGTYDQEWQKEHYPGLAADMDPTFFNTAPEDQQLHEGFFNGDESFAVTGMNRERETVSGRLPGLRTRCFISQSKGDGAEFREVHTRLDTVWLFPGVESGIVIYRGAVEVSDDEGLDVLQILTAYERLSDPLKTVEHYQHALAARMDKNAPPLLTIDERDLLPSGEPSPLFALLQEAQAKEEPSPLIANLKKKSEKEIAARAEMFKKAGLPVPVLPPPEGDVPMDPDAIEAAMEKLKAAQAQVSQQKEQALARAREMAEKAGLDFDQLLAQAKQRARRPGFNVEQSTELLRKAGRLTPELEERLNKARETVRKTYVEQAQYFPPPVIPEPPELDRLRDEVVERRRVGRSCAGLDLAGINFSGLDLKGVDLSGALLETVDLTGADLSGANLAGAVIAHSKLVRTKMVRANLAGANLGDSDLSGADCTGAVMTKAVLTKSNLTGAVCADAALDEANFLEAVLVRADLSRTRLNKMNFYQNDLREARLIGADLSETNFIMARLDGADLTGATGKKTVFFMAEAAGCVFAQSTFESLTVVEPGNFSDCDFRGASIKKSGFTNVNLDRCKFAGAALDGTIIMNSTMREADLTAASAPGARFERVNLEGAKLRRIDLSRGSLRKCRLVSADLTAGNFFMADLFRIVVGETRFDGANFDCTVLEKMVT